MWSSMQLSLQDDQDFLKKLQDKPFHMQISKQYNS